MGDHDGGRERRLQDVVADARREDAPAPAAEPGEAAEGTNAGRARAPDPVRVPGTERSSVGVDDDVAGGAGEQPSLVVDDRAASPSRGTVRNAWLMRGRRVLPSVQHLDRPGAQEQEREPGHDDDRQPAHPDVEAGAAEVRRVGARIGLEPSPARQVAGKLQPTARIRSRDRHGLPSRVVAVSPVGYSAATRPRARRRGARARTSARRAQDRRAATPRRP